MNRTNRRLISLASILSGIFLMTAHLLNFGSDEFGTVLGNILVFTAHLLLVFTFFGVFIHLGERTGLLGLLAMILGVIGNIIVTSIVFVEIAQASGGNAGNVFHTPATEPMYAFGPLLFVLGMVLLGVSVIREKIFPPYSGYLLLVGTIIFALASVFVNNQSIIEIIGAVFTGAGFITIGIRTINHGRINNGDH